MRLAEQEELLLEKELVYDQVTRLSRRIRAKAENGKQDTLDLAKKVRVCLSLSLSHTHTQVVERGSPL